jgi:hypothetical protein
MCLSVLFSSHVSCTRILIITHMSYSCIIAWHEAILYVCLFHAVMFGVFFVHVCLLRCVCIYKCVCKCMHVMRVFVFSCEECLLECACVCVMILLILLYHTIHSIIN